MIFDHYDQIRVINLPYRRDRRREMEHEFGRLGMRGDPKIAYFPAIRPQNKGHFTGVGTHGAFLSHLGVLESALEARHSVLVLEDDCRFLDAIKTAAQDEDTTILYGGYALASDERDLLNADIEGAHCMGFSVAALEQLVPFLRSLLDLRTPIDPLIVRSEFDPMIRPPIDGAYVWFRRYHPQMKTQFLPLTSYRLSATDVGERKWFDRVPVLRAVANQARRIKEQLA